MSDLPLQNEITTVSGKTIFQVLPDTTIDTIPKSVLVPNVINRTRLKCINTVPISITNFKGGSAGQTILLLGDGQTTLVYNINNIITNTGVSKLLVLNRTYTLTLWGKVWSENA